MFPFLYLAFLKIKVYMIEAKKTILEENQKKRSCF